jgi:hypothetical protein
VTVFIPTFYYAGFSYLNLSTHMLFKCHTVKFLTFYHDCMASDDVHREIETCSYTVMIINI